MAAQGESTFLKHRGNDLELTKEIDVLATIEHRDETNVKGLAVFLHEKAKDPLRDEAIARALEQDEQKKYDETCEFYDMIVGLIDRIPDLRCLLNGPVYLNYLKAEALKAPEEQSILVALGVMKEWLACTHNIHHEAEKFAGLLDSVPGFVGETSVAYMVVRDIEKPLNLGYKLRDMLDARLLEVDRENARSMRGSGEIARIDASQNVLRQ